MCLLLQYSSESEKKCSHVLYSDDDDISVGGAACATVVPSDVAAILICVNALCTVHTAMESPGEALLRAYPQH